MTSVLPWMLMTLVLATGLSVVALIVNGRAVATAAADAAALAAAPATFPPLGLGSPEAAAIRLATENGAVVTACSCRSDASWAKRSVEVEVAVEVVLPVVGRTEVLAVSRAEFEPVALTGW